MMRTSAQCRQLQRQVFLKTLRHLWIVLITALVFSCTEKNDKFVGDSDTSDAGTDAAADPCQSYEQDCCTMSHYRAYGSIGEGSAESYYDCYIVGRLNDEPQCNAGSGDLPQAADTLARFCGEVYSFECTCDQATGCATITVDSESTHLDHKVQCPGDF